MVVRILVVLVGAVLTGVKFVVIAPTVCTVIAAFDRLDENRSREAKGEEDPTSKPRLCCQLCHFRENLIRYYIQVICKLSFLLSST